MNPDEATKPRMPGIQNFSGLGTMGVLLMTCSGGVGGISDVVGGVGGVVGGFGGVGGGFGGVGGGFGAA
jgi:hypothetical protein